MHDLFVVIGMVAPDPKRRLTAMQVPIHVPVNRVVLRSVGYMCVYDAATCVTLLNQSLSMYCLLCGHRHLLLSRLQCVYVLLQCSISVSLARVCENVYV